MSSKSFASYIINHWKLMLAVAGVLALIVVVIQNTANVQLELLFMTVSIPKPILIGIVFLVGTIFGAVMSQRLTRRK